MLKRWIAAAVLLLVASGRASAQSAPAPQERDVDTRGQYPAILNNSYFTINVGSIGYLFTTRQLQPGFTSDEPETPRIAARVDLFGHRFSKYFAAQATYMRPAKYVVYKHINGGTESGQVAMAYGGVTLVGILPVTERISFYGEGGGGVTSRQALASKDGGEVVKSAHYLAGLLGAGVSLRASRSTELVLGFMYSPGREAFDQPSMRLFTAGFRYQMLTVPEEVVAEKRRAGYVFPANIIRGGVTTNEVAEYAVNNFLSGTVPVFWGGRVQTAQGVTLDYQRNIFHTRKYFAFDVGASASYWESNDNEDVFRTLSIYPLFRFFLARSDPADIYFSYSLAGPTLIDETRLDGKDTGENFTFQDFIGLGMYIGKGKHFNAEVGIKHFSNGNIFVNNASIKVPLTFTIGYAF